jgi:hypothetical protein
MANTDHTTTELTAIERERIVSINEAARLRGMHADTIKRNEPEKLVRLSPRRLGMRLKDALKLAP